MRRKQYGLSELTTFLCCVPIITCLSSPRKPPAGLYFHLFFTRYFRDFPIFFLFYILIRGIVKIF